MSTLPPPNTQGAAAPALAAPTSRFNWSINQRKIAPYIFIAPFVILFIIFTLGPLIDALTLSFHRTRSLTEREYVGLANYERLLFQDARMGAALANGAEFAAGTILIQLPLALLVAMALNSPRVLFRTVARLAFFTPFVTSAVVVAILFGQVFNERYGLLNGFLVMLGMEPLNWLRDKDLAMSALIILGLWTWVGYNSLFFLAGLQNIPDELIEAARIDGANEFQIFLRVTIPLLRPVVLFVFVTGIMGSFNLFAQPYLLFGANGGQGDSALFPLMYLYQMGFRNTRLGYASAIGFILMVIILIVTAVQLFVFRFWKTE